MLCGLVDLGENYKNFFNLFYLKGFTIFKVGCNISIKKGIQKQKGLTTMKEWYVKMKLSGIDYNIPVIAKDKHSAKGKAITYATKMGYIKFKVLNIRRVTT